MGFKCKTCGKTLHSRSSFIMHRTNNCCSGRAAAKEVSSNVSSDKLLIETTTRKGEEKREVPIKAVPGSTLLQDNALFMVVNLSSTEAKGKDTIIDQTGHKDLNKMSTATDITESCYSNFKILQGNDASSVPDYTYRGFETEENPEITKEFDKITDFVVEQNAVVALPVASRINTDNDLFEIQEPVVLTEILLNPEDEHTNHTNNQTEQEVIIEDDVEVFNDANAVETAIIIGKKRRNKNPVSVMDRKKIKLENLKTTHPVLSGCGNSCKKQCATNISQERRSQINTMYWDLSAEERKAFIFGLVERSSPKRRTSNACSTSSKVFTFKYKLQNETGTALDVCKVFFLTTLGYKEKNDKVITTVLSKTPKGDIKPVPDLRGKAPCSKKGPKKEISDHVESYHPDISHYRREHAPNKRYLPSDLTITLMHEHFVSKFSQFKDVSYDQYRKVVKEKNISFAKLGHEECEVCEGFKLHPHTKESKDPDCSVCQTWSEHMEKAIQSREAYQRFSKEELPEDTICFACDLQKVIMLPRVDTFKVVLFLKRLTIYNETFSPVGKTPKHKPFLCLWHEGITGRNKEELTSCFYKFLKENRDYKNINLWLDNCSSQNKNWCLYTFLINVVNSNEICAQEINLWYFEPGHTFMAADSTHHQIELALKKQGKTYDFRDFVNSCKLAHKGNVSVAEMEAKDFYLWKDNSSVKKLKDPTRPKLTEIAHVKAQRGSFVLKYKKNIKPDEEYKTLDFLLLKQMKSSSCGVPPTLSVPRGFCPIKRDKLLKELENILPENRKIFWKNLPVPQ